jgi:hypothetical protein
MFKTSGLGFVGIGSIPHFINRGVIFFFRRRIKSEAKNMQLHFRELLKDIGNRWTLN